MQEEIIGMTISEFEVDALQLYFGEPFSIPSEAANDIVIFQPTIGDIIHEGEKKVYSALNTLIANPTMYRLQLWKMGIDWNKLSDFDLFCMLSTSLDHDSTKLLFGDLDFQLFKLYQNTNEEDKPFFYLYNDDQDYLIDESTYQILALYLKTMFNIFPKTEKAKGKATKEALIWEDQQNYDLHKDEPYKSTLLPLISSCLNHPGFKYKKNELKKVGIVEFMDSVQRLQIYESSTALLKGIYSGFIDASKINKDDLNFMRDLSQKK